MTNYVAGFLFNPERSCVALILKDHPDYQAGKYNAIGGKTAPGETPAEAMHREFNEEAGLDIRTWVPAVLLQGSSWRVFFFVAIGDVHSVKTAEREKVVVFPLPLNTDVPTLPNLRTLIALCLDDTLNRPVMLEDRSVEPSTNDSAFFGCRLWS